MCPHRSGPTCPRRFTPPSRRIPACVRADTCGTHFRGVDASLGLVRYVCPGGHGGSSDPRSKVCGLRGICGTQLGYLARLAPRIGCRRAGRSHGGQDGWRWLGGAESAPLRGGMGCGVRGRICGEGRLPMTSRQRWRGRQRYSPRVMVRHRRWRSRSTSTSRSATRMSVTLAQRGLHDDV